VFTGTCLKVNLCQGGGVASRIGLAPPGFIAKSSINFKKKFLNEVQVYIPPSPSATMPTATTTKSAMAGTKRKSSPVKNGHVKESKKPKIESGLKSALKSKPKSAPKKLVESSDLDSDSDSDGGAPLDDSPMDLDEEEGEDSSEEDAIPKVEDGLHPERAKAAATSSKFTCSCETMVN
jgi:hypothetical protein